MSVNDTCKRALNDAIDALDNAYDTAPIGSTEEREIQQIREELHKLRHKVGKIERQCNHIGAHKVEATGKWVCSNCDQPLPPYHFAK